MNVQEVKNALAKSMAKAAYNIRMDGQTGNADDCDYNITKLEAYLEVADQLGLHPDLVYGNTGGSADVVGVTFGNPGPARTTINFSDILRDG